MNPPSLSEIEYQPGDIVWAWAGPGRRAWRGVVREVTRWEVLVDTKHGRWYHAPRDLRPYSAIDQLADLIRCETCGEKPADCECFKFTITECAGADTDMTWTYTTSETASNCDPITALGDLIRDEPERRPLSNRERHRRRRRSWLAKCSRRRNR